MLKTKVFLLQEFVNLQKWLFLAFEDLNCCKCLKNKEKSIISDALCLVVGINAQFTSQLFYIDIDFYVEYNKI